MQTENIFGFLSSRGDWGDIGMSNTELFLLSVILIGLLGVVCLMVTISIKVYINNKSKAESSAKKDKFQEFLAFVISGQVQEGFLHDHSNQDAVYLSKEDLQDESSRTLLLKELMALHAMILGDEQEKLKDLYLGFGYAAEIPSLIFSKDWEKRVEAINQISAFQLVQFYPILVSCLNDKNKFVKKTAFLKYAGLKSNPIDALNYVEGKINLWEKQVILKNLKKRSGEMVPLFSNFKTKYPEHSEFLDEMAVVFNQGPSRLFIEQIKMDA